MPFLVEGRHIVSIILDSPAVKAWQQDPAQSLLDATDVGYANEVS